MAFLCATDNFVLRTIEPLASVWEKLCYVASLREPEGNYHHWGLMRMYGEAAAQEAICEIHRSVLLEVLRTPVRDLLREAQRCAAARGVPLSGLVRKLSEDLQMLLPPQMGGASAKHFSSVLQTLGRLERAGSLSRHQVS